MWFLLLLMVAVVLTPIAVGLALVVCFSWLIRASIKMATNKELSAGDRSVIASAILLALLVAGSWVSVRIDEGSARRQVEQRNELVEQVLHPISRLPTEALDRVGAAQSWELHNVACDLVEVSIDPDVFRAADRPMAIDADAEAFRSAGWVVSFEALPDHFASTGVTTTFRASDADGTTVTLEPNAEGLVYRITDSQCADSEFAVSRG